MNAGGQADVKSATEDEVKTYLRAFKTTFIDATKFDPTDLQKADKEKMKFIIPMVTTANLIAWTTTDASTDILLD